MGLPQLSSVEDDAPTASRTSFSCPTHCGDISACDLDGLASGGSSSREFSYPLIGEFNRKTALDAPNQSNGYSKDKNAFDEPADLHGLKIDSRDANSGSYPKLVPSVRMPARRVVGFESDYIGASNGTKTDKVNSSLVDSNCNLSSEHELQARKRLLSPLKNVLPKQFHDDMLNISSGDSRFRHSDSAGKLCNSGFPDNKKANTGCLNSFETRDTPTSRCSNWSPEWDVPRSNSNSFTGGPLLGSKDTVSYYDHLAASAKLAHSPLSLSPLSPKYMNKIKVTGSQRYIMRDLENDFLDLKETGRSDGTRMQEISEETNLLHDELDVMTPKWTSLRRYGNWGPESSPTSPRIGYGRSSSLLVRRSLVGSFEESLLSGRYSYGKDTQTIDGFLAVLSITGGSFFPTTQKLPFSVTSIDEDSSLLYYSSIDLAGRLPTNNSKSPKLQRSYSNNDSRSAKSRLRIPVKGRIQLVVSNPEKTPLHTFFCNYDLSDMPSGTKAAAVDRTASQMTNQKKIQTQDVVHRKVIIKNRISLALLGIRKAILILMIAAVKWKRLTWVERNHAAHLLRSMIVQVEVCFVMLCTYVFCAPPPRNPRNQCYGANLIHHQRHTAVIQWPRKSVDSISTMILELYFLKGTQIQMKASCEWSMISPLIPSTLI